MSIEQKNEAKERIKTGSNLSTEPERIVPRGDDKPGTLCMAWTRVSIQPCQGYRRGRLAPRDTADTLFSRDPTGPLPGPTTSPFCGVLGKIACLRDLHSRRTRRICSGLLLWWRIVWFHWLWRWSSRVASRIGARREPMGADCTENYRGCPFVGLCSSTT